MCTKESCSNCCCFFGHREIDESEELGQQIYSLVEKLILQEKVDTFLFGSKSRFNSLCYEQMATKKSDHPCFMDRTDAAGIASSTEITHTEWLRMHFFSLSREKSHKTAKAR